MVVQRLQRWQRVVLPGPGFATDRVALGMFLCRLVLASSSPVVEEKHRPLPRRSQDPSAPVSSLSAVSCSCKAWLLWAGGRAVVVRVDDTCVPMVAQLCVAGFCLVELL